MLAWSIALLATILPAFPVKDFTGVRKAATRSDDNRMGVIATLRYEKLSDMKMPRMNSQTFATANGLMIAGSQSRGVDIYNPQYNSFPSVDSDGTVLNESSFTQRMPSLVSLYRKLRGWLFQ
jgi:hypothetical protein